jgi:hypothetical protein
VTKTEKFIAEFGADLVEAAGLTTGEPWTIARVAVVDTEVDGVRLVVEIDAPPGRLTLIGTRNYYEDDDSPANVADRVHAALGGSREGIEARVAKAGL